MEQNKSKHVTLSEEDGAVMDALMVRDRAHFEYCGCHMFMRPVEQGDRLKAAQEHFGTDGMEDATHMVVTLIAPDIRTRRSVFAPAYRGQLMHPKLGLDPFVEQIRQAAKAAKAAHGD